MEFQLLTGVCAFARLSPAFSSVSPAFIASSLPGVSIGDSQSSGPVTEWGVSDTLVLQLPGHEIASASLGAAERC